MAEGAASRLTFFSKKELECPVDGTKFHREDLLSGRGRLIAGDLTIEMRRLYEASQKFGTVIPLVYPITVCPGCYYAALNQDFSQLPESSVDELDRNADSRISGIQHIFQELDFHEPRTLREGVASYFFAIMCYDFFPKEFSPVIKQAICALRAAWLFNDLHRQRPEDNFDYLAKLFYRKAHFFYALALEYEESGKQSITNVPNLGPDIDQNYGYDGVLYLSSYLELHHGPRQIEEKRAASLQKAKTTAARLFGMGRASKQKPSAILDKARDLYNLIGKELDEEDEEDAFGES